MPTKIGFFSYDQRICLSMLTHPQINFHVESVKGEIISTLTQLEGETFTVNADTEPVSLNVYGALE
jgi:hypothetical protein